MKKYAIRMEHAGCIKPVFRMEENLPAGILTFDSWDRACEFTDALSISEFGANCTNTVMIVDIDECGCEVWYSVSGDGDAGPDAETFCCAEHHDKYNLPENLEDELKRGRVSFSVMASYGQYELYNWPPSDRRGSTFEVVHRKKKKR